MKNKKGFTLIELLAVIVILGLLVAIAIPSVTKYITESRKKTVVSTIGNYITAMVNEVNDLTYTFTGDNTIYAVPIECIALERGGTDPFGAWHQANDAYWAYVLVQYDDETSSYRYGYTFKDSAGYGLYPTSQAKLNEGGKQIQTGLDLNRPKSGKVTVITAVDNWSGFSVDSSTDLVVLKSEVEGNVGDGISTCTLQQKGDNYEQVKNDKDTEEDLVINTPLYYGKPYDVNVAGVAFSYIIYENGAIEVYFDCAVEASLPSGSSTIVGNEIKVEGETIAEISSDKKTLTFVDGSGDVAVLNLDSNWCSDNDPYADLPMLMKYTDGYGFWAYKEKIKTITFQSNINVPNNISSEHKWDMTKSKTGKVMAYITPNANNSSYYDLYIQGEGKVYANPSSYHLFSNFEYVDKINNIEVLDTSKVITMMSMFHRTGYYSKTFKLDLGNNFDTSNVTYMEEVFMYTGHNSSVFELNLGSKFDTSKVTNMNGMFWGTGSSSEVFTLDLGDKFDTSNVTDMSLMFGNTGSSSPVFTLDLGNKFNTSKVTNMYSMFSSTGSVSSAFALDCSEWNVDKVTNYEMFNSGVESKVTPPNWKK